MTTADRLLLTFWALFLADRIEHSTAVTAAAVMSGVLFIVFSRLERRKDRP